MPYHISRGSLVFGFGIGIFISYYYWKPNRVALSKAQRAIDVAKQTIASFEPKLTPKVFIISKFPEEENGWHSLDGIDLSRSFSDSSIPVKIHHSANGEICQVAIGMGLVQAAVTMQALLSSRNFDFRKTYFLIAGIAGICPNVGTLGSVILAKYAVQVDLQYELDAREIPKDWVTGFYPQGARTPYEAPRIWYGSEVFELNENLRDKAVEFAQPADLKSSPELIEYCNCFQGSLEAAKRPPSTIKADVASSNTFFHGKILSETFHQSCKSFTNNAAEYGVTDQESSAILTALLHGALAKRLDFSRVILMKAGSNFDQPPEGEGPEHPIHHGHGGITLAFENLYLAGTEIVTGILTSWEDVFNTGVPADNYIGDVFGSLGGKPDYGPDETQMDEALVDDEVIDDI